MQKKNYKGNLKKRWIVQNNFDCEKWNVYVFLLYENTVLLNENLIVYEKTNYFITFNYVTVMNE